MLNQMDVLQRVSRAGGPDRRRRRLAEGEWALWDHPGMTMTAQESPFLLACRRQEVPFTPVWYMRQAGRALPEYRALRTGKKMLDACSSPDLIMEITLQPVHRYQVDAAILFSDIVIKPGVGPIVDHPIRSAADVARLRPLTPGDIPYISKAVTGLVGELKG